MSNLVPGWKECKLRDLCIIHYGKSPNEVKVDYSMYAIWGTGGKSGFANNKLFDGPFTLVGRKGTISKPLWIQDDAWVIDTAYAVMSKNNIEEKFLYYLLDFSDLKELNESTGVPSLNRETLYNFKVRYSERREEQKKIAEILSSIDKVIELTKVEIIKLKNLKKGMMQDLLTKGIEHTKFKESPIGKIPESWLVCKVSEVIIQNIYGPRFSANDYNPHGNVRTIRGTDVDRAGSLEYRSAPVAQLDDKLVKTHTLKHLDVIVVTTADCGVTAVFEEQSMPYIPSAYMVKLRFDQTKLNPYFFKFLMGINILQNQVESSIRKGTVANLPGSDLISFKIPIPSIAEQDRIVAILTSAEQKLLTKSDKLKRLNFVKNGLLQDLLTGKVRVKV